MVPTERYRPSKTKGPRRGPRASLVWHTTWSVNSVTHVWGYRNYATPDGSRNNLLIGFLSGGEGWHNNHHAAPSSCATRASMVGIRPVVADDPPAHVPRPRHQGIASVAGPGRDVQFTRNTSHDPAVVRPDSATAPTRARSRKRDCRQRETARGSDAESQHGTTATLFASSCSTRALNCTFAS
jgi:hypothetical protein